jgi:hypothetical protein
MVLCVKKYPQLPAINKSNYRNHRNQQENQKIIADLPGQFP